MTVRRCVQGKFLTGAAAQKAESLLRLYDEIVGQERLALLGDDTAAEAAARAKAAAIVTELRAREKLQDMLQLQRTAEALRDAGRHDKGLGNGIQAKLGFDIHHTLNDVDNVETVAAVLRATAYRNMAEFVEAFRAKGLNIKRDIGREEDLLRGLFRELTEGEPKIFADAFTGSNRLMVAEYKLAGGHLPERQGWFPNPNHDMNKIRFAAGGEPDTSSAVRRLMRRRNPGDADRAQWIEDVLPLLDREKMVDFDTKDPLSDLKLRIVLAEVWDTLSSDGLNKITPGGVGRRKVANLRNDPRILNFKDADSWLAYAEKYGDGGIVSAIDNHIERFARDIALMRVLGPNPDQTIDVLIDTARKAGVGGFKRSQVKAQFRIVAGRDGVVSPWLASAGQNIRALLVANQLGSSALTALSDIGFIQKTAEFNGLSSARALSFYAQAMADRELGINMTKQGIILDDWLGSAVTANRFMDAVGRGQVTGRIADSVLRGSLLTQMTQNGRRGFGLMMMGEIHDNLAKAFDALDGDLRAMLTRYGFTADDWAIMGRSAPVEFRGEGFFDVMQLMEVEGVDLARLKSLGERVQGMVIQEQQFAVPTSNARVQALLTVGTQRGTPEGEIFRFFAMYKRFPALILHTHAMRAIAAPSLRPLGRADYIARLVLYTTIIGTLSWEIDQMARGREHVDPFENPSVWVRGMLKGGALGIWGDVLLTDVSGYGRGIGDTFAGPAWDFVNDTASLTLGNLQQVIQGRDTNVAREFVKFFDRYLTPGSSIWYLKGAWDRIIIDNLEELADPAATARRRRRRARAMAERGQGFLIAPGAFTP